MDGPRTATGAKVAALRAAMAAHNQYALDCMAGNGHNYLGHNYIGTRWTAWRATGATGT